MKLKLLKLISLGIVLWSLSLMVFGVCFDVEINSGPPIIVKSGSSLLRMRMGEYKAENFEYATTDYEFCTNNGFKGTGISLAFYSVIGSETSDMGKIRVPKLHMTTVYPAYIVVFIFITSLIYFIRIHSIKSKKPNKFFV